MKPRRGTPVEIRGVLYISISAAARALGVDHSTICCALDRGRIETVGTGKHVKGLPVIVNGVEYASCAEAARAVNRTKQNIAKLRRKHHGGPIWTASGTTPAIVVSLKSRMPFDPSNSSANKSAGSSAVSAENQ